MNSEDRKNLSETIKNYAIALSIVAGGIWAIFTFTETFEAEKAKLQIQNLSLSLTQRPIIEPTMKTIVSRRNDTSTWVLRILVEVENKGNSDTQILIDQQSIKVAKAIMENGTIIKFNKIVYTGERDIPPKEINQPYVKGIAKTLLSNQKKKLDFIVEVDEPGIYMVLFDAKPGKKVEEFRSAVDEGVKATISGVSAREFIIIEEPSNKASPVNAKNSVAD